MYRHSYVTVQAYAAYMLLIHPRVPADTDRSAHIRLALFITVETEICIGYKIISALVILLRIEAECRHQFHFLYFRQFLFRNDVYHMVFLSEGIRLYHPVLGVLVIDFHLFHHLALYQPQGGRHIRAEKQCPVDKDFVDIPASGLYTAVLDCYSRQLAEQLLQIVSLQGIHRHGIIDHRIPFGHHQYGIVLYDNGIDFHRILHHRYMHD